MNDCKGWCAPLYVYIAFYVLSITSILLAVTYKKTGEFNQMSINSKIINILVVTVISALVGWLIFYLCKKCQNNWAWLVVFAPIIINVLLLALLGLAVVFVIKAQQMTGRGLCLRP